MPRSRTDERNVTVDMRHVLSTVNSTWNQKRVAETFLCFLEDKYDTKEWVVTTSYSEKVLPIPVDINQVQLGEFHKISENGFFTTAISINRTTASQFNKYYHQYLKDSEGDQKNEKIILTENQYETNADIRKSGVAEFVKIILPEISRQVCIDSLVFHISCISSKEREL